MQPRKLAVITLALTAATTLLGGGVSAHPPRPAPTTLAVVPTDCSRHLLAGAGRDRTGYGCTGIRGGTGLVTGTAPDTSPPRSHPSGPTVVQRRTVERRASRTAPRRAAAVPRPRGGDVPARPVHVSRPTPAHAAAPPASRRVGVVIRYALNQVGDRYVWGAAGNGGYDCSGLVMASYARVGVRLPHFSGAIARTGRRVPRSLIRPGDVLGYPGHVAIYLGGGRMVEAANPRVGVRVARLRAPAWVRREL